MTKIQFRKGLSSILFCFFIIGILSNAIIPQLNDFSNNNNNKELQNIIPKVANIPNSPILQSLESPDENEYLNLTWSLVIGADSYNVYRFSDVITEINGSITIINSTSETSYQDHLISNGTYYYSITAVNASGESQPSNCEWVVINFPTYDYKYATGVEGKDWVVGELPAGFTTTRLDTLHEDITNFQIISDFAGHEKVLQIYDDSTTVNYKVLKSFPSQSKGFLSGFIGTSSEMNNITIEVKNSNYDHGPVIYMYSGRVYARVMGVSIDTGARFTNNEFYHFVIEFDLGTQTYDFYWNGEYYGNFGYYETISYLNVVNINTWGIPGDYYIYLDGIICSGLGAANPFVNFCPYELLPDGPILHEIDSPDNDGNITLTWDFKEDADYYNVYNYGSPISELNSSLTLVTTTTENYALDFGLLNGTYYYVVTAINSSLESLPSNCESVGVAIPPIVQEYVLNAPILDSINSPDEDGTYNVSWTSVAGVDNYMLYRDTSSFVNTEGLSPIYIGSDVLYQEINITEGIFYYGVVATNSSGESPISNIVSVVVSYSPENPPDDGIPFNIPGFPIETLLFFIGLTIIGLRHNRRKNQI